MKVKDIENGIQIQDIEDFDTKHIFECGQCFRWNKEEDGSYTGIAYGKVINVMSDYENKTVIIKNTNKKDFDEIWNNYFDLDRDYCQIKNKLSKIDIMNTAIQYGKGIRILNQDPWELLISFIISSNNNIPRISKIINCLSQMYGKLVEYEGNVYYAFPTLEEFKNATLEDIQKCRAGYRCKYIYNTIQMISLSLVDLDKTSKLNTSEAKKELIKLSGVGSKVADCVLLFSMQKHDTYPIDVWVKRVTEHFFLGKDTSLKDIETFARGKFGDLAGFAQQYLFYYARVNKIM